MEFTNDQRNSLESGQPVEVTIHGIECVVIRKDAYENTVKIMFEDSELPDEYLRAIAARKLDDLDTVGPI